MIAKLPSSIITGVLLLGASQLHSQTPKDVVVVQTNGTAVTTQASGGSVKIPHGLGAVSNRSSLELQWIMVTDSSLGLIFDGPVGASGVFDDPWYRYSADMRMKALQSIAAFEVRILTFDIWHQFTGALSFSQLEDLTPNQQKNFGRVWGIYGESQLRDHFISIAYVAKVRYLGGKTVIADPTPALKAAQAIQGSVTLQDLEPKPEPVPLTGKKT